MFADATDRSKSLNSPWVCLVSRVKIQIKAHRTDEVSRNRRKHKIVNMSEKKAMKMYYINNITKANWTFNL